MGLIPGRQLTTCVNCTTDTLMSPAHHFFSSVMLDSTQFGNVFWGLDKIK